MNWDTSGQIDVIDGNGNTIALNLAALIVAPNKHLNEQNRALSDLAYTQCGGNYDSRNYLDTYNPVNAISGEVNYFSESANNRVAANENNKRFVMANSDYYNDQFMFITVDDIFLSLIRRSDFGIAIGNLLDNPIFSTIPIIGSKGTDKLDCKVAGMDELFCKNWKEMLFLTQLPTPASISIDGAQSGNCNRVLIFSGKKISGQRRDTAAEKSSASNYLEGINIASFNAPTANASNFSGASTFDWRLPGTDIIRCLL